jgi:hypothetical protein
MTDLGDFEGSAPPDLYADALEIGAGAYGLVFRFGLATQSPGDQKLVATIRMSPQHALVMYQILKRNLREYEKQVGKINLPDELFDEMGLEREI